MEEGAGRLSKSEDEEVCYEIVLPSNVRDRLIKSHEHDYLNMSRASTTAIDVLTWTKESPRGLNPIQKLQATKECLKQEK